MGKNPTPDWAVPPLITSPTACADASASVRSTFGFGFATLAIEAIFRVSGFGPFQPTVIVSPAAMPVVELDRIPVAPAAAGWVSVALVKRSEPASNE